jgi:Domain of unknown function (DUF1788)
MSTFAREFDRLISDLRRPTASGKFFIVVYPPHAEPRVQRELPDLRERLGEHGISTAVVNVNQVVNTVIEGRLDDLQDAWVNNREGALDYMRQRSIAQLEQATYAADSDVSAIWWTRVGGAYPFFRIASVTERLIARLNASLVVLYPGAHEAKTHFALLGKRDGYQYRFEYVYEIDES